MLVLSVWWKKGKAMKTLRSLTQHRTHMFHKMHSIGWTSCNIEAGDSFIMKKCYDIFTSDNWQCNIVTYDEFQNIQDHLQVIDDDSDKKCWWYYNIVKINLRWSTVGRRGCIQQPCHSLSRSQSKTTTTTIAASALTAIARRKILTRPISWRETWRRRWTRTRTRTREIWRRHGAFRCRLGG